MFSIKLAGLPLTRNVHLKLFMFSSNVVLDEFVLSSLRASLSGRLFLGVTIFVSASCIFTSSRYFSNATDG